MRNHWRAEQHLLALDARLIPETDFRWLRPTSASLAHLTLQVPPGFRQVPPPA